MAFWPWVNVERDTVNGFNGMELLYIMSILY